MTLLHWSFEHISYNHDSQPQLDFLHRQTEQRPVRLCVKSQDDKWHLTKLCSLPGCACEEPWAPGAQQGSACCSHLDFQAEPPHQKLVGPVSLSPFGNPSLSPKGLGKWVALAWIWDIPHPGQQGYSWEPGGENHLSYSSQIKPTLGLVQWYGKLAECCHVRTQQNHI